MSALAAVERQIAALEQEITRQRHVERTTHRLSVARTARRNASECQRQLRALLLWKAKLIHPTEPTKDTAP